MKKRRRNKQKSQRTGLWFMLWFSVLCFGFVYWNCAVEHPVIAEEMDMEEDSELLVSSLPLELQTAIPKKLDMEFISELLVSSLPLELPVLLPEELPEEKLLVVIDPGHQEKADWGKEPVGPGADAKKTKVSAGTKGVSTGIPEYELALAVSLYLKEELLARGYEVIMTRETNDVNISNLERALMANEVQADVFIRLHADNAANSKTNGVMTICQTPDSPYNSEWYEENRRLSELVLEEVTGETGANKRRIWETNTMTGINWAEVPTTLLEMGFMSNPEEDERMATEEYRKKIAKGVADAIDRYFGED